MRIGVIFKNYIHNYDKNFYPFGIGTSSLHHELVRRGHRISLIRVDENSQANLEKRKHLVAYNQMVDCDFVDIDDPSIDKYHLVELYTDANDLEILKPAVDTILRSKKPVIYTDADGEIMSQLSGYTKRPSVLYRFRDISNLTIYNTGKESCPTYQKEFPKAKVVYSPFFLTKSSMMRYIPEMFEEKQKDFVFVGRTIGRPHLHQFFELVSKEGLSGDVDLWMYDRMDWKSKPAIPNIGLVNDLAIFSTTRKQFYQRMSRYKYTYIGGTWHTKRTRPHIVANPPYSTFRVFETILSNQLFLSYRTPEMEEAEVDKRLLMNWSWDNLKEEHRAIQDVKNLSTEEYEELKSSTHKKILTCFGQTVADRLIKGILE
jgi:hypothetical protein